MAKALIKKVENHCSRLTKSQISYTETMQRSYKQAALWEVGRSVIYPKRGEVSRVACQLHRACRKPTDLP